MAGFLYPNEVSPTDLVYFDALIGDDRNDESFQNVGFSEDYKSIVYSHSVAGSYGFVTVFKLRIKIGQSWGANKSFSDLRDFIRTTINYAEKQFTYQDAENNNYKVKFREGSFDFTLIPGTTIYMVTLEIWQSTD